jgi:hypothetical protein
LVQALPLYYVSGCSVINLVVLGQQHGSGAITIGSGALATLLSF